MFSCKKEKKVKKWMSRQSRQMAAIKTLMKKIRVSF
jgi:hypothetical protein